MFVTLLRGGMHLILANPPGVSYKSVPRKFRETRSTMEGMLSQSHCVAQFNTAQKRLATDEFSEKSVDDLPPLSQENRVNCNAIGWLRGALSSRRPHYCSM